MDHQETEDSAPPISCLTNLSLAGLCQAGYGRSSSASDWPMSVNNGGVSAPIRPDNYRVSFTKSTVSILVRARN